MHVRISGGKFDAGRAQEVASRLRASETSLRPAVEALPGFRAYFVGLDRRLGFMTNTSVWDSLEAAEQMSSLPEMLALRQEFDALGVKFDPITNHEQLWQAGFPDNAKR